jgi:NADPH:quinone reductase-like Zn-dependent oxidoreductase
VYAAVVHSFASPPTYERFPLRTPAAEDEAVVDVIASGLHQRVRSQADGSHYTTTGGLPLVPGIDGVGRLPTGELLYFVLSDTPLGAMAEQTIIDRRRSIELPGDIDPVLVAAGMNPGMSSWAQPGVPASWRSRSRSTWVPAP